MPRTGRNRGGAEFRSRHRRAGIRRCPPEAEPEPAFSFDVPGAGAAIRADAVVRTGAGTGTALTFDEPADRGGVLIRVASIEQLGLSEDRPTEQPVFEPEPFVDAPSAEELRELDFYIEQELFDEARQKLDALAVAFPGNAARQRTPRALDAAIASITALPRPRPPDSFAPPVLSRDEIESELLSALPDDDDDFFAPAASSSAAARGAAAAAVRRSVHEENLFADEDDFFDLAAELESELEEESEEVSLSEEEQSLEEIFKEFKKGVEQQLDSEDYDTHYNLGIAYKEMGLIDEAIGEFQLASKDPKRAVECASMLGLCFLEKGMPQLAIKWYRKGLEMPEITAEEHVGLLYDLGSAYVEVGDTDNAQKAFVEVYGLNPNYRDIVTRIKQLEDARTMNQHARIAPPLRQSDDLRPAGRLARLRRAALVPGWQHELPQRRPSRPRDRGAEDATNYFNAIGPVALGTRGDARRRLARREADEARARRRVGHQPGRRARGDDHGDGADQQGAGRAGADRLSERPLAIAGEELVARARGPHDARRRARSSAPSRRTWRQRLNRTRHKGHRENLCALCVSVVQTSSLTRSDQSRAARASRR